MEKIDYRVEKYSDGTVIVEEGTWAYYAYVIRSGKAKVIKNINGKQNLVATLKEGDVFGEMAIIGGVKRTASVIADGDVEIAIISRDVIIDAIGILSKDARAQLTTMTSELSHITSICALLANQTHEIEGLKNKVVNRDLFVRQIKEGMKDMPEAYQLVFETLTSRFNNAVETLVKLGQQIKNAVDDLEVPIKKENA